MVSIVMKTHIRHDLTYLTAKKAMKASAGLLRKLVDLKDISMALDFFKLPSSQVQWLCPKISGLQP